MNLKTPYEKIITEKLEQALPVPDMADAIWARIELQLDATPDAGTDTSPSPETAPAKAVMSKTLAIVIGGILTLVLLFILLRKSTKKPGKKNEPAPVQQTIKVSNSVSLPDTAVNTGRFIKPDTVQNSSTSPDSITNAGLYIIRKNDSLFNEPLQNARADSNQSIIIPRVVSPSVDSSVIMPPPFRKPRGVKGINDGDYKILSGKKDSLIKKNK